MSARKPKAVPTKAPVNEIIRAAQAALDRTIACSTYERWQFRARLRRQLRRLALQS